MSVWLSVSDRIEFDINLKRGKEIQLGKRMNEVLVCCYN